jgi:hypothetical protein
VFTAGCHGSTLLYICIAFFDLASPFNFQSLGMSTPSASARIVILSVFVSDLKYIALSIG